MTTRTFTFNVAAQPSVSWTPPAAGEILTFDNSTLSSSTLGVKPDPFDGEYGTIRGLYTETTVAYFPTLGDSGAVIAHGGGHNNWNYNGIFKWDIATATWTRHKDGLTPVYARDYIGVNDSNSDNQNTGWGEHIAAPGSLESFPENGFGPGFQPCSTHTYDTLKPVPAGVLTSGPAMVRVTAASAGGNAIQYPASHYIDIENPNTSGWQRFGKVVSPWFNTNYGSLLYDPVRNGIVAFRGNAVGSTIQFAPASTGIFTSESIGTSYQFGECRTDYWSDPISGLNLYVVLTGLRNTVGPSERRRVVLINADNRTSTKVVSMDSTALGLDSLSSATTAHAFVPSRRCFYFVRNTTLASDLQVDITNNGCAWLEDAMYQAVYKLTIPDDPWNGTWVWSVENLNPAYRPIAWYTYANPYGDGKSRLVWHEPTNCLLWFPWPTKAVQAIGVQ